LIVAKTLLSGDYRRIPVINNEGKVVHVITMTQMVEELHKGISELDPTFLKHEVKDMKHMSSLLQKVKDSKLDLYQDTGIIPVNQIAKAIEAFRLIISTHVSAVPIVDSSEKIIGCVSTRHIRAISSNASEVKVLYDETCGEFIKRSTLKVEDISVSKYDTMKTVLEKFYVNKIHRLWVIENEKIVGAVTVKNLFTEMLDF
jgi:CBS domain-containing protein